MSDEQTNDPVILVDFGGGRLRQVSRGGELETEDLQALTGKSKDAAENALNAIGWVAKQARDAVSNLHEKPTTMEIEFGIKITTQAGVIIMSADGEFHIKAKLVWDNSAKDDA